MGETFLCSVCANDEVSSATGADAARQGETTTTSIKRISGLRIQAEIISPSNPSGTLITLQDGSAGEPSTGSRSSDGSSSTSDANLEGSTSHQHSPATVQKLLRLHLIEPGPHTLSLTVTYTETTFLPTPSTSGSSGSASISTSTTTSRARTTTLSAGGARVRTFRKLYPFNVTPLLSLRSKAADIDDGTGSRDNNEVSSDSNGGGTGLVAVEVQVENLADTTVVLDHAEMITGRGWNAQSLNAWDVDANSTDGHQGHDYGGDDGHGKVVRGHVGHWRKPILRKGDIEQVVFLMREKSDEELAQGDEDSGHDAATEEERRRESGDMQRHVLGRLRLEWRGSCGDRGSVTTGWLTRKR